MITFSRTTVLGLVLFVTLGLSACQSGEERAEEHYQRALELIEEGDFDRARVEFLNVFNNQGNHRAGRSDFAAMLRGQGDTRESYSQYLRLVEQYPDDVEGRIALAEMALEFTNFEEAVRHGERAIELAPDDPRIPVLSVSLAYGAAIEAEDEPARRDVYDAAMALLAEDPENLLLLRLQVDGLLRDGNLTEGLAALDAALVQEPDNWLLYQTKLQVLAELDRLDEVEELLLEMLDRFPEDEELPATLLRFYLSRGQEDQALAYLRAQTTEAQTEEQREEARLALVQLQLELDGPEAALREIDQIIEEAVGDVVGFRAQRAAIRFDQGETDAALAEMEALLSEELTPLQGGRIRVGLARMLLATGNAVGARAQIEQVLEADPSQTDALKMRAAWHIDEDEGDQAIALLRLALDNAPDDAQALTLMAQAHSRNGNHELAQEFLSLAVEASNSAPAETLRYVRALIDRERYLTAEELLIASLRLAPGNLELMTTLGELYIRMEDWPRAEQVEATLRADGGEETVRIAAGLQASRLSAQGRTAEAVGFLEDLAAAGGATDVRAQIAVIQARLSSGDGEGALLLVTELAAGAPDEPIYRFALAATQSALGDLASAEETFRGLTETNPELQQGWLGLIRSLNGQGRLEEAESVLAAALEELPDALDLLWAQASYLEQGGDYEGAIAIYERMYERAPQAEVVANNLASLLSTYRDDEDSLERAWAVARRLRGNQVPPFQDTYGWIAYRRGEYEDALEHLEPAAQGLPEDPLAQFHLGMTYAALDRAEEAIAQLQHALEIAGPEDTRAQFETARAEIERLQEALAAAETEGSE